MDDVVSRHTSRHAGSGLVNRDTETCLLGSFWLWLPVVFGVCFQLFPFLIDYLLDLVLNFRIHPALVVSDQPAEYPARICPSVATLAIDGGACAVRRRHKPVFAHCRDERNDRIGDPS